MPNYWHLVKHVLTFGTDPVGCPYVVGTLSVNATNLNLRQQR